MSDKRSGVLVIGGANYDFLVKGSKLPAAGDTVIGEQFVEAPGGKGANQAIAAARLGARTAFVGRVGRDARGTRVLAALRAEGVDTSACVEDDGAPTGVALVLVGGDGQKMIMTAPGANLRLCEQDIERAAPLFAASGVVLLQLEAGVPTTVAAARRGAASGARVVLDAAPPEKLPDELVAALDVIRCNAGEAAVITGVEVRDVDSARRAALQLRERGAGAACIGAEGGDLLVFAGGEVWLPHQGVEVVDTTGAGDAFAAGLAVGLAESRSVSDAGWLGCVASALKATQLGAQAGLPRRADVDRMLAATRGRS